MIQHDGVIEYRAMLREGCSQRWEVEWDVVWVLAEMINYIASGSVRFYYKCYIHAVQGKETGKVITIAGFTYIPNF